MAGSRLEKIGTIFSRTTGLLRAGALKQEDQPLWYNVYKAFPPREEPRYDRPVPTQEIPNIFYPEDVIRAKFYKTYGSPGIIDMSNPNSQSICQKFVDYYLELQQKQPDKDEAHLFQETTDTLLSQGIVLMPIPTQKVVPITIEDETTNVPSMHSLLKNLSVLQFKGRKRYKSKSWLGFYILFDVVFL